MLRERDLSKMHALGAWRVRIAEARASLSSMTQTAPADAPIARMTSLRVPGAVAQASNAWAYVVHSFRRDRAVKNRRAANRNKGRTRHDGESRAA
jgi:hypothetical protein